VTILHQFCLDTFDCITATRNDLDTRPLLMLSPLVVLETCGVGPWLASGIIMENPMFHPREGRQIFTASMKGTNPS
jgi:hypothetical protein